MTPSRLKQQLRSHQSIPPDISWDTPAARLMSGGTGHAPSCASLDRSALAFIWD